MCVCAHEYIGDVMCVGIFDVICVFDVVLCVWDVVCVPM